MEMSLAFSWLHGIFWELVLNLLLHLESRKQLEYSLRFPHYGGIPPYVL